MMSSSAQMDSEPINRKWSANCLELISVRLDHLDNKYTSIIEQYGRNHKALDTKIEHIKTQLSKMETHMAQNTKLTEAYNNIRGKLDSKMAEVSADAKNWFNGLRTTLDMHARQKFDNMAFDANVMQEQRGLVKLDEMIERLRSIHGSLIEDLNGIIEKRQMAEGNIIQTISDETKRLNAARNTYGITKQEIRACMSKAVSDLKKELMGDLAGMIQDREEFEDLVLETLERQMSEFTVNKGTPINT